MDDRSDVMSTPEATGLTIADLEAMPDDMVIRNLIWDRVGERYVEGPPDHRYGAPTVYEHDDVAAASVLDGFSVAVAALLVG